MKRCLSMEVGDYDMPTVPLIQNVLQNLGMNLGEVNRVTKKADTELWTHIDNSQMPAQFALQPIIRVNSEDT